MLSGIHDYKAILKNYFFNKKSPLFAGMLFLFLYPDPSGKFIVQ
jgi:hypothetical protein